MEEIYCNSCNVLKPRSDFYNNGKDPRCKKCESKRHNRYMQTDGGKTVKKEIAKKYWSKVKEEQNKKRRKYAKEHPEAIRKSNIKAKYGITSEQYNYMFYTQHGLCAICGTKPKHKRTNYLFIDHDHKTKQVRGLLCTKCNLGIGQFNDSAGLLERAAKYLSCFNIPTP